MKGLIVALLWPLVLCSAAFGGLSIHGYFEPQYSGTALDGEYLQLNSNKLRVDLESEISQGITFTGNFNYINYNGRKEWNLLDFLPDHLLLGIPQGLRGLYSLAYEDENELDNAYLRAYWKAVTVTVGKQQVSVGPGYAWNPTDLFNIKDILDPTYEQPGVNGLRLDLGLGGSGNATAFYSPEDTWEKSGKLLRLTGTISHFDWALSVGERNQAFTDFTTFQRRDTRRTMFGADINGELLGMGCWTENAYNSMKGSQDYWENLVGLDYTFVSGWYVMAEYYHNEQGRANENRYSLTDWLSYFTTETKTLARDQFYAYTSYPITDLLAIGGSTVYGMTDNSILLIPTAEYSVGDNVTLTFFGSIYAGGEGAMYSADMGQGGLIRLRAYF